MREAFLLTRSMFASAIISAECVLCRQFAHPGPSPGSVYSLSAAALKEGSGKSDQAEDITFSGERAQEAHLGPAEAGSMTLLSEAMSQSISAAGPEISVSLPALSCTLSAVPTLDIELVMQRTQAGEPASGYAVHSRQWIMSIPEGSSSAFTGGGAPPPCAILRDMRRVCRLGGY